MGWLQLVGSIKLWVSSAKEPYKRDAILQNWPIILSILLTVATSHNSVPWHMRMVHTATHRNTLQTTWAYKLSAATYMNESHWNTLQHTLTPMGLQLCSVACLCSAVRMLWSCFRPVLICDIKWSYEWLDSFAWVAWLMGWLRWVGSLKLQVSCAKQPYKRDYILQKRPVILKSLLIVATPYVYWTWLHE